MFRRSYPYGIPELPTPEGRTFIAQLPAVSTTRRVERAPATLRVVEEPPAILYKPATLRVWDEKSAAPPPLAITAFQPLIRIVKSDFEVGYCAAPIPNQVVEAALPGPMRSLAMRRLLAYSSLAVPLPSVLWFGGGSLTKSVLTGRPKLSNRVMLSFYNRQLALISIYETNCAFTQILRRSHRNSPLLFVVHRVVKMIHHAVPFYHAGLVRIFFIKRFG